MVIMVVLVMLVELVLVMMVTKMVVVVTVVMKAVLLSMTVTILVEMAMEVVVVMMVVETNTSESQTSEPSHWSGPGALGRCQVTTGSPFNFYPLSPYQHHITATSLGQRHATSTLSPSPASGAAGLSPLSFV